jgi:TetR/AcrR family tetracycline transcriptional repressor
VVRGKVVRDPLEPSVVVHEALTLLNDVGLNAVSTRRLAARLGVEQPSLYWHFPNKKSLLVEMARTALEPHVRRPLPSDGEVWREWLIGNMASYRETLLSRRDGARLHVITAPDSWPLEHIADESRFLVSAGFSEEDARHGIVSAWRFTIGCALAEELQVPIPTFDADIQQASEGEAAELVFEFGLELIVDGLSRRRRASGGLLTAGSGSGYARAEAR